MINKLSISVEDDLLKEYLSRKNPGDTCVFEIAASIDEITDDQAVFSVEEVNFDEEGDEPIKPKKAESKSEDEYSSPGDSGIPPVMLVFGKNA